MAFAIILTSFVFFKTTLLLLGQKFNQVINNDLKKEKNEEKQGERRYLEGESTGMMGES